MGKNDELVVDGANLKCSMGDILAKLRVTSNDSVKIENNCKATKDDCTNENLLPPIATFGTCKPYKAVPPPGCLCTFVPTGPWKGTYSNEMIKGKEVLIGSSYLMCGRPPGGKIRITQSGQSGKNRIVIEKEPLKCPLCGKSLDDAEHKCDEIPPGVFIGDGGKLGNHILKRLNGENKFYGGKFENHPFYYPDPSKIGSKNNRNGIEAHHLITNASLKKSQKYQALVYMLGYNINHRNNGVLLPSIMEVACTFGVPLHESNHGATFIIDRKKDPNAKDNEHLNKKKIIPLFPVYNQEDELAKLNYEKRINKLMKGLCEIILKNDKICKKKDERIKTSKRFINALDKSSKIIFSKIKNFEWTITSDGFTYSPGNIGCCGFNNQEDKRKFLKEKLVGVQRLAASEAKKFWGVLYSSEKACNYLTKADFRCIAGTKMKNHYRNPSTYNFYQERENIEKFQGFKKDE